MGTRCPCKQGQCPSKNATHPDESQLVRSMRQFTFILSRYVLFGPDRQQDPNRILIVESLVAITVLLDSNLQVLISSSLCSCPVVLQHSYFDSLSTACWAPQPKWKIAWFQFECPDIQTPIWWPIKGVVQQNPLYQGSEWIIATLIHHAPQKHRFWKAWRQRVPGSPRNHHEVSTDKIDSSNSDLSIQAQMLVIWSFRISLLPMGHTCNSLATDG